MHRLARKLATLTCFIACFSPALAVETKGRVRNATAAEIRAHLNESSQETTTDRHGYTYRSGSNRGYKIANGKICIRFADKREDCAAIKTDGQNFHMITRDGTRSRF